MKCAGQTRIPRVKFTLVASKKRYARVLLNFKAIQASELNFSKTSIFARIDVSFGEIEPSHHAPRGEFFAILSDTA